MKEKMVKFLQELYSNLGVSKSVLSSVADVAIVGLSDDATDDDIKSRASESSIADMLKSFQAYADKRVTDAVKAADDKRKAEKKDEHKDDDVNDDKEKPKWLTELLESQKAQNEALMKRLETLEGEKKAKSFDEIVAKIGKELDLEGSKLDLCKAGLSSDMDEKQIRDMLGARAKQIADILAAQGGSMPIHGSMTEAQRQQMREEETAWVKAHQQKEE